MRFNLDSPSLAEWRALYDVMLRVQTLAPWRWMVETQVFGVKNPETGGLGFVSVLGSLGEYRGVHVYLGARGLLHFNMIQAGSEMDPQLLFETAQLQASFVDREELEEDERKLVRRLKVKVRQGQEWPQFRSQEPGFVPWYIDAGEARFLTAVLEQLLIVAPRLKTNRGLLPDADRKRYLMRYVEEQPDGSRAWTEREQVVQPPGKLKLNLYLTGTVSERFKQLPRQNIKVAADMFMLPTPVQSFPDLPAYFPYALLLFDYQHDKVLNVEMLRPLPELKTVWESAPQKLLEQLVKLKKRPHAIYVIDPRLANVLNVFAKEFDFRVNLRGFIPHLMEAENSLIQHMLRSRPGGL